MQRICVFVLTSLLFAARSAASDEPTKQPHKAPDTKQPAFLAEFRAIQREVDAKLAKVYATVEQEFEASKTQEAREAVQKLALQESRRIFAPAAQKAMTVVRPHAADPAAVEALVWIVNGSRGSDLTYEAAELLQKHHLTHQQTLELAYRHNRASEKWTESLLRAQRDAIDISPSDKPRVLFALAVVMQTKSQLPGKLDGITDEELLQLEAVYGKDRVADLRIIDVAKAETEAIKLFTELDEKYGLQKLSGKFTFGDLAKTSIFEIQHLSVGKTAPDIRGEDTDGVEFKLSDYRGKVVVLSFWATWCGPCMALVPHERELVERLKDKPFVLIGVNADADKPKLKDVAAKEKITWRSFWCGEDGPGGAIPMAWNVTGWPTIYVLDRQGVTRAKQATGKSLDRIVDKLISEDEAKN